MRARLRDVVLGVLGDCDIEFGDELSPSNCAAWDSVAMVQIMLAVEQEFGVQFTTDEISKVRCIGDLVALLHKHGVHDD
jgi:acyl carrier protein